MGSTKRHESTVKFASEMQNLAINIERFSRYAQEMELDTKELEERLHLFLADLAVDSPSFIRAISTAEKETVVLRYEASEDEDDYDEQEALVVYSADLTDEEENMLRLLLEEPLGVIEEETDNGSKFLFTIDTGSRVNAFMLVDVYMKHKAELDALVEYNMLHKYARS